MGLASYSKAVFVCLCSLFQNAPGVKPRCSAIVAVASRAVEIVVPLTFVFDETLFGLSTTVDMTTGAESSLSFAATLSDSFCIGRNKEPLLFERVPSNGDVSS
jgi:hypothetical protein